jgi:hypothetical protein
MKRRLFWPWPGVTGEEKTIPQRPYRDSVIFNAVLAVLVVGIALVTGGAIAWALLVALVFFFLATVWSWLVWRRRLRGAARSSP